MPVMIAMTIGIISVYFPIDLLGGFGLMYNVGDIGGSGVDRTR
jgi:hypothetical protein